MKKSLFNALKWTPVTLVFHDHFFGIAASPLHTESALLSDSHHITRNDHIILYNRTSSPRPKSLIVFNSPSHFINGSALAIGRVSATTGDLLYSDSGQLQIVKAGQICLSHQNAWQSQKSPILSEMNLFQHGPNERLEEASHVEHASDMIDDVDAPTNTSDFGGFIPQSLVEGEAIAILWPPSQARFLK